MNKQAKSPFKRAGQGGNRRFLINAAVLAAGCLLVILRMPSWGVAQVVVLILLAALSAFQLLLYFKMR